MANPGISLTPALEAAIVAKVRQGVPPATAAAAAGIPTRTVQGWFEAIQRGHWADGSALHPDTKTMLARLADECAAAQAEFEAESVQKIMEASGYVSRAGVPEWRARAWLLNNLPSTRKNYHEYRETVLEHRGEVGIEHRLVHELPDTQLLELASPDLAGLIEAPAGE